MFYTRPYGIWSGMKRRCYNKNEKTYARYGAKGIKMSKEWRSSFMAFWEDMKDTYFDEATIDRIDNTKGYFKENCRWVTKAEQARNKKSVKLYEYEGRIVSLGQLEKELGITKGRLAHRVKRLGWTIKKAIETPKLSAINNINKNSNS